MHFELWLCAENVDECPSVVFEDDICRIEGIQKKCTQIELRKLMPMKNIPENQVNIWLIWKRAYQSDSKVSVEKTFLLFFVKIQHPSYSMQLYGNILRRITAPKFRWKPKGIVMTNIFLWILTFDDVFDSPHIFRSHMSHPTIK